MDLERKVEAVLFYKAEPVPKRELGNFFSVTEQEIEQVLNTLKEKLQERGIRLIETDNTVGLTTAPELAETIESLRKEDMKRDIGKAGAETLGIILYRGPITRAEIDFIRGVNSAFILRSLLMRGLVERSHHPKDKRQFQYAVTTDLLAHLGIENKTELPDYETILNELDRYEKEYTTVEEEEVEQT